jgi:hypothetical protein
MYAGGARPTGLRTQVDLLNAFIVATKPAVEETRARGAGADVLAILQAANFPTKGKGPPDVSETPITFRLRREGGGWKLADNAYLRRRLNEQHAADLAARRQQNTPKGP